MGDKPRLYAALPVCDGKSRETLDYQCVHNQFHLLVHSLVRQCMDNLQVSITISNEDRLGSKVLLKEDIAFKAAVLYLFNHALVYNLALQTEVTYTFLTLLGLLIAYRKVQPQSTVRSVQCNSIIPANFFWGLNVLTRAQGLLMLGFSG